MVFGTVKFFDTEKSFGFINAEDGNEYFVHYSDVELGLTLHEGDSVEFIIEHAERGPKAGKVKLVTEPSLADLDD